MHPSSIVLGGLMTWEYEYAPRIWPMMTSAACLAALGVRELRRRTRHRRSAPGALPLASVLDDALFDRPIYLRLDKAVVVSDVLYCGVCKTQPEPIEMPELYRDREPSGYPAAPCF